MNRVDIQRTSAYQPAGFDVFVNGDHYLTYHTHDEAIAGAREAAGDNPDIAFIRDYSQPVGGSKFTVIPLNLPKWTQGDEAAFQRTLRDVDILRRKVSRLEAVLRLIEGAARDSRHTEDQRDTEDKS